MSASKKALSPENSDYENTSSFSIKSYSTNIVFFLEDHFFEILDILIALTLFGLGIWFRHWLHYWFEKDVGRIFYLRIEETNFSGKIGKFLGISPGNELPWEGYFDWTYYYKPYIENFLDGWNPYSGSREPGDPLNGYVYGPFYIYFISIPAWLFHVNALDSAVWSNIVFDSGIISLVYLIARTREGIITSLFAAALYFFSPIVLFFSVVRVLNMPQVTFFIMLYFYLLITGHDDSALIALIIAILTKQIALFIIGPALVYWYRKYGILKGTSFPFLSLIYMIIGSYPWIAISFNSYMIRLFSPGKGKTTLHLPKGGESVTLAESFYAMKYENFAENVRIALNYFDYMGLLLIVSAITGWLIFFGYHEIKTNVAIHAQIYAFFILGFHATLARGIYKYYDPIFIPFLILGLIMNPSSKTSKQKLIKKQEKQRKTKLFKLKETIKNKNASEIMTSIIDRTIQYFKSKKFIEDLLVSIKNISVLGAFFFLNERILDINRYLHPLLLLIYSLMVLTLISFEGMFSVTLKDAKQLLSKTTSNTYYFIKGILSYFKK